VSNAWKPSWFWRTKDIGKLGREQSRSNGHYSSLSLESQGKGRREALVTRLRFELGGPIHEQSELGVQSF